MSTPIPTSPSTKPTARASPAGAAPPPIPTPGSIGRTGVISAKWPDTALYRKMLRIAADLGAAVQDDDGARYPDEADWTFDPIAPPAAAPSLWPRAAALYWAWLHVVAIDLAAEALFLLALRLGGAPEAIAVFPLRDLVFTADAAVWLTLPAAFAFAAYARPYRWFWFGLTGLSAAYLTLGFFGYVLPWGQLSFWLAAQGGAAPGLLAALLPLARLLLPLAGPLLLLILLALHIRQIATAGAFAPYAARYSRLGLALALIYAGALGVDAWLSYTWIAAAQTSAAAPDAPSEPSVPGATAQPPLDGGPLATPAHIVPEWNFLPFYALLRAVPDKAGGVAAMVGGLLVWLLVPWLDPGPPRPFWRRPGLRWIVPAILASFIGLGALGALPPGDRRADRRPRARRRLFRPVPDRPAAGRPPLSRRLGAHAWT